MRKCISRLPRDANKQKQLKKRPKANTTWNERASGTAHTHRKRQPCVTRWVNEWVVLEQVERGGHAWTFVSDQHLWQAHLSRTACHKRVSRRSLHALLSLRIRLLLCKYRLVRKATTRDRCARQSLSLPLPETRSSMTSSLGK